MEMLVVTVIIAVATAMITAAFVTFLGCCSFKVYMTKKINSIGEKMIELAVESIRNAHFDE